VSSPVTERFVDLVSGRDDELPLDEAALLIAAHAKPALRVEHYLGRLDELASMVDSETLAGVLDLLYRREGFRGNEEDYYDERNSYLDEVLDRRLGIPITLAVVLMEVGRRIGLRLVGLNTPGHFLVAHLDDSRAPTAVDPFTGMVLPDAPEVTGLVAGPRLILARMLGNLRQIHGAAGDRQNLGWVLRLRAAIPDLSVTERAEALAGLGSAAGQPLEAADGLEQLAAEAAVDEQEADRLRARATQLRAKLN
jgi:regulator of sirC expression with transglutaminase-like and TPR domain